MASKYFSMGRAEFLEGGADPLDETMYINYR